VSDARRPESAGDLENILRRGVVEIIPEAEFVEAIESGRRLRLKLGLDPSKPDLHIGHGVLLRKLRRLQDLGHTVVLIVGDWTARIGDPSGQSITRPMLTADEVKANADTYMRQFFHVVDKAKTEVRWQSEWFDAFTLADVVRLAARFTVAQMLQREDFRTRFEAQKPLGVHELLYPLLQAYDSYAIEADVEFGGSDQLFNMLVGRELQQELGQRSQAVFVMDLLVGTDGVQKMTKSLGNTINFEDPPDDKYGKVMSIPDSALDSYLVLATNFSDGELIQLRSQASQGGTTARDLKKRVAREVVEQFHGRRAAREAEADFESRHTIVRPEPAIIRLEVPSASIWPSPPPEVRVANLTRAATYKLGDRMRTAKDATRRFNRSRSLGGYEVFVNATVCDDPSTALLGAGDVVVLLTHRRSSLVLSKTSNRGWVPLWARHGVSREKGSLFRKEARHVFLFDEFDGEKFLAFPFRGRAGVKFPLRWLRSDGWSLTAMLTDIGMLGSASEVRRLVSQGAIDVNGVRVQSPLLKRGWFDRFSSLLLRVGKHRFLRIVDAGS